MLSKSHTAILLTDVSFIFILNLLTIELNMNVVNNSKFIKLTCIGIQ